MGHHGLLGQWNPVLLEFLESGFGADANGPLADEYEVSDKVIEHQLQNAGAAVLDD